LRDKYHRFDVIHDNQSLSYGLLAIQRFVPTTATIHHPITQDRRIDLRSVSSPFKKIKLSRWYSFLGMQKQVARRLSRVITVSNSAAQDIHLDFGVPRDRFRVAPLGISTEIFRPIQGIDREENRLITTTSADIPLKGLAYLLHAMAALTHRRDVRLTVIGQPRKDGPVEKLVRDLDIGRRVDFTGRVDQREFVEHYARSSIAVVPSLYEGFGLPAGEAMACGLPVVSTTGGALPEVVGDAGVLVPPADSGALVSAIGDLMDHPDKALALGEAGYRRVQEQFTWSQTAQKTAQVYRETIHDHRRLRPAAQRSR
jgi:glycosyltransferase involved in cell wall biosynthesis